MKLYRNLQFLRNSSGALAQLFAKYLPLNRSDREWETKKGRAGGKMNLVEVVRVVPMNKLKEECNVSHSFFFICLPEEKWEPKSCRNEKQQDKKEELVTDMKVKAERKEHEKA